MDSPGDNILAEFSSVVNAVLCAMETQEKLGTQNAALPENRRMLFRIGIHLGDIIQEGTRIYGYGGNLARQEAEEALALAPEHPLPYVILS